MGKHQYIIQEESGLYVFHDSPIRRRRTTETVKELNVNSSLPLEFLCKYTKEQRKKLPKQYRRNFMSFDYFIDGGFLIFSGYPHDEADNYLTRMEITDSRYNVFGIKPGDSPDAAPECFINRGYKMKHSGNRLEFFKSDVTVTIEINKNQVIDSIDIYVETFYVGNRIY